ncbi:MAG: cold shock domain-containing protein [Halobacteria archaeon]|nr:cold shock domain-containing protein [Halobacteria archaeon]
MAKGTVKFYHDEKGYGFIELDEEDEDVFFHISEVAASTTEVGEGEEVEFEVEQADEGPRAINVKQTA